MMPIYEYACDSCRKRMSLLIRNIRHPAAPVCPRCGSRELTRLLSRFAVVKSEESRLERMADPGNFGDLDENDPKSVARWAKRMGKEMGEDVGEDFDQMMEEAAEGEGTAGGGAEAEE
jgi:putative FmdB family regulatory protein